MIVSYTSKKLAERIAQESDCLKYHGKGMTHMIHKRLGQLSAATTLETLRRVGRCHELKGKYEGCFALDLVGSYRLIFKPDGEKKEYMEGASILWNKVESVEIIAVIDYH